MKNNSANRQEVDSMKFCISGKDRNALREAHYRAMSLIPEEVSGVDHYQNSFIVDSKLNAVSSEILNPFLRWCESLGDIKVEKISCS